MLSRIEATCLDLERLWERQNRTTVLAIRGGVVLAIAIIDWWTKPYVSLGFLYLFPIMLVAAFLPRWILALLGLGCDALAEVFSSLAPSLLRLTFETVALASCGLFVGELVRNRRFSLESQARLKALVETSPAAIVTVDEQGSIELANHAAIELFAPRAGHLVGDPIAAFLPELHHAIRWVAEQQRGDRHDQPAHRKILPLPLHLIGATLVLDYRIRVPRGASLFVEHDGREVNVENLTGDVQVTTATGPITVRVPGDSSYWGRRQKPSRQRRLELSGKRTAADLAPRAPLCSG